MGIVQKTAIVAGAFLVSATSAQAQDRRANAELTSEMWALAGVCSQYGAYYSVRHDALADWLNVAAADPAIGDGLSARKDAKVAQISALAAEVRGTTSVRERDQRFDEMSSALMTRCRRLTNDPVAREFFLPR